MPAILVSPYVKKGLVDHTQYDSASILRAITHPHFALPVLDGLSTRDKALVANGGKPMGDFSAALALVPQSKRRFRRRRNARPAWPRRAFFILALLPRWRVQQRAFEQLRQGRAQRLRARRQFRALVALGGDRAVFQAHAVAFRQAGVGRVELGAGQRHFLRGIEFQAVRIVAPALHMGGQARGGHVGLPASSACRTAACAVVHLFAPLFLLARGGGGRDARLQAFQLRRRPASAFSTASAARPSRSHWAARAVAASTCSATLAACRPAC